MTPKPVVQTTICSDCGLDWTLHKKATSSECIRLLKDALAKRPPTWSVQGMSNNSGGYVVPINHPKTA